MYKRLSTRGMLLATLLLLTLTAAAQMANPVRFQSQLNTTPGKAEGELVFSGKIEPGWHVYSTRLGGAGPVEASLKTRKLEGVELVGPLMPRGHELSGYDNMFGATLRYFEGQVQFVQKVRFTQPHYDIDCYLEYGACSDEACLPPAEVTLKKSGTLTLPKEETAPQPLPKEGEEAAAQTATLHTDSIPALGGDGSETGPTALDSLPTLGERQEQASLYRPVTAELHALDSAPAVGESSWLRILLMGFVGGLLAVLMPCIWPIIPMTVSFFLKRAKDDRRRGIRDAVAYGLSIVAIYLTLGLAVTALFGSDTLNALSTNAVFNLLLFALLVVFALSLFGWFELRLPQRWANAADSKAGATSGLLSIVLMATTLVIVSFSCTAPIVGLLLVETATTGNLVAPVIGMLGFALALALPFTLFALFPSWLKKAPRSGSWMNTLKVTLGFVELAFALKFLSVADLAYGWHLLPREAFLALWIAIFTLLGLYLIGVLRFQSDEADGQPRRAMPVACIVGGLLSTAFAVYLLPGLWGAPCKAVSAFAPPMNTQDFNLNTHTVEARFFDYETAMAAAQAEGKPVLIDFTGYGCVNCRKMEAAVWTDPRVASRLTKDYILVSLYVDDRTPLAQPFTIEENGQRRTLTTVKDKWSWLQAHKFGANTQPFYVALAPDGTPLAAPRSYNEDVDAYLQFLDEGLQRMRAK